MNKHKPTRGNGLLESFLANKRSQKAYNLLSVGIKKDRILDIGCGSYPYFLMSADFKEKYGIDPALSDFKISDMDLKKIDVSTQALPFPGNYFNAVTMLAVFEHIDGDKLIEVLREIRRVLKKDGVFIITTPSPWADKLLHNMAKLGLISSEEIHEHKHNHKKSRIEDILEKAGFDKSRIKSGYFEMSFNMWFVAKK